MGPRRRPGPRRPSRVARHVAWPRGRPGRVARRLAAWPLAWPTGGRSAPPSACRHGHFSAPPASSSVSSPDRTSAPALPRRCHSMWHSSGGGSTRPCPVSSEVEDGVSSPVRPGVTRSDIRPAARAARAGRGGTDRHLVALWSGPGDREIRRGGYHIRVQRTFADLTFDLGRAVREARLATGWAQEELSERASVSRSLIAKVESGRGNVTLASVAAVCDALGIRAALRLETPFLADRRSQLEPAHARGVAYVQRCLERDGWRVAREVEIYHGRSRGWIDLLALHPDTEALLVIEYKTELRDIGLVERTLAWYERSAPEAAGRLGWRPRSVASVLLMLASEANEIRLAENRFALAGPFPVRAPELRRRLVDPGGTWPEPARALALVDPLSRRGTWLRAGRLDGNRSRSSYVDYADFMRRTRARPGSSRAGRGR